MLSQRDQIIALPRISHDDPFVKVVKSLSVYFVDEITLPSTFEQLRTTSAGKRIHILVQHLVRNVTNPALINALLTLKWHFSTLEVDDHRLNETRAFACEMAAYRFLSQIPERDAVDFCLYELPELPARAENTSIEACDVETDEQSSLLPQFRSRGTPTSASVRPESRRVKLLRSLSRVSLGETSDVDNSDDDEEDPTSSFTGLNGLEIAAVADCKRFLSQRIVQNIVQSIFHGRIVFFQSLDAHAVKKPQFYNKKLTDPFLRLRVPRYIKAYEVFFFVTFLALYYAVLVERDPRYAVTPVEVCLYVWLAAFAYDELSEFIDAGSIFYAVSIWNGADLAIILIGIAFVITRIIGIVQGNTDTAITAFNILSLEALFLIPRACSILSLNQYFGTLIPCLERMAKDFVKFMMVVGILYLGFLTTFWLLARDFTLSKMSWVLVKVFFGSSYLGFDIMTDIDPHLGPPLMLIFICMTNILLITSLISILSDSFSKVIAHSREEYLFVYSVYVLEASTSNRLTHFYPPLNLIPLLTIRPLRLFISAEKLRVARILLLKITHAPILALIILFESTYAQVENGQSPSNGSTPVATSESVVATSKKQQQKFLSRRSNANTNSGHYVDIASEDGASDSQDVLGSDFPTKGKKVLGSQDEMVVVSNAELESKVAELSSKIAELTALIMTKPEMAD